MSGLWAVLVREIRDRRAIPLAALALGVLPVIAGWVPALTRIGGSDVRDNLALVLGLAFPTAVALGLGASVIGRDVAEGRLGFYFSRPISGFALWAGKMGATIVLIGASALLVSLPARVVTDEGFLTGAAAGLASLWASILGPDGLLIPMGSHDPWLWRIAFAVLVLGAAGAHAAGTMVRSRSGLLPLDLGLLIATLFVSALAAWRIVDAGAPQMFFYLLLAVLWGTLAACLAAGVVQVMVGRGDRRRGHLVLSAVLWGALLTGAGALHLSLSWAFAMTPADITFNRYSGVGVGAAPRGRYFAMTSFGGGRLGYSPAFLVSAASGRFVRVGATEGLWELVFAQNGHTAAWIRLGRQPSLGVARLEEPTPRLDKMPLPPGGGYESVLALTPEGDRVLLRSASGMAVVESSTGRLVAEAKAPSAWPAYFDSNDLVRLHGRLESADATAEIVLLEWNLRTGRLRETGRLADTLFVGDRQGSHLLVATVQGGLDLKNAETGQLEQTLLAASAYRGHPGHTWSIQPRFLADGRVAAVVNETDGDHVEVFPAGGGPPVDGRIDGGRVRLVGESLAGELVLEKWNEPEFTVLFVDTATGQVRKRESGIRPAVWNWRRDLRSESVPGSLETRLFLTPDAALVDRDPAQGTRRIVVQGRKQEAE